MAKFDLLSLARPSLLTDAYGVEYYDTKEVSKFISEVNKLIAEILTEEHNKFLESLNEATSIAKSRIEP